MCLIQVMSYTTAVNKKKYTQIDTYNKNKKMGK